MGCRLCPRGCGADRATGERGLCGADDRILLARAAPHMWEEPPISGSRGSGAIFFAGCPLGCIFCQNREISRGGAGAEVSEDKLGYIMLSLAAAGAHNINLVTPTHYSDRIARVLGRIKERLGVPVIYNCGGYERPVSLAALEGLIDIYLPDFKYFSPELSRKYSGAPDYYEYAAPALAEMYRQVGRAEFDGEGLMRRGMIVRHMVLPSCRADSAELLRRLAALLPVKDIKLSLMSQYTPEYAAGSGCPELMRRLTSFEYNYVLNAALSFGFDGYYQERGSANAAYTPDFDLSGI